MWQLSIHQLSSFHQAELVRAEPPRLTLAARTGDLSSKAVRLAADRDSSIPGVEMPARDMNPDLAPEFVVLHKGPAEIDPLGVAHQPGGIVVLRSLHCTDPDGELKRATVGAYGVARGSCHGDPNISRLTGRGGRTGWKVPQSSHRASRATPSLAGVWLSCCPDAQASGCTAGGQGASRSTFPRG